MNCSLWWGLRPWALPTPKPLQTSATVIKSVDNIILKSCPATTFHYLNVIKCLRLTHSFLRCCRFPVPLSPSVVRSRLTNNYYRSVKAVKHDIDIMMSNATSYFVRNLEQSKKMQRMADYFERTLSNLWSIAFPFYVT